MTSGSVQLNYISLFVETWNQWKISNPLNYFERGKDVNFVILALPQHTNLQTETGGHVMTPLPGCTPTKPGSACFPFFGVVAVILDEAGKVIMKINLHKHMN